MFFERSSTQQLAQLMGATGALLIKSARVTAWQPDPDHQPAGYYLVGAGDEAEWQRLNESMGLSTGANGPRGPGIWRLPPGLEMPDWAASDLPAEPAHQSHGTVGTAAVWLRWHGNTIYAVVMPSAP